MKILSVYNIKGGVGKTASIVNLAYIAAERGKRSLVCDLDPQGSATFYFRVESTVKGGTKPILKGGKRIRKNLKGTDFAELDLLPADFSFRNLDIHLDHAKRSKKRLKESLGIFGKKYDYVFIDCPPNITLVSENIFYASDNVLVPVVPTTLSLRTFEKLLSFFKQKKLNTKSLIPFFSMVEKRKNMHRDLIQEIRERFPEILKTEIPYSSIIEKMGVYREPAVSFSPKSAASMAYIELWSELEQRIENR